MIKSKDETQLGLLTFLIIHAFCIKLLWCRENT